VLDEAITLDELWTRTNDPWKPEKLPCLSITKQGSFPGFLRYLPKPFTPDELYTVTNRVLGAAAITSDISDKCSEEHEPAFECPAANTAVCPIAPCLQLWVKRKYFTYHLWIA
jgi:hypothetical protein